MPSDTMEALHASQVSKRTAEPPAAYKQLAGAQSAEKLRVAFPALAGKAKS